VSHKEEVTKQLKCRYLGQLYPFVAVVDETIKKNVVKFDGKTMTCLTPIPGEVDANKALKKFYKKEAKKYIEKRLRLYQPKFKTKYKSFEIESVDARWGSCSSQRNLTFNWKLMLFPEEAIDYVVIHELCHLEHLNHDRSFWRLVGKHCPDYKNIMPILGTSKTRDM
jgi:predicted metal-dependent hydrolase